MDTPTLAESNAGSDPARRSRKITNGIYLTILLAVIGGLTLPGLFSPRPD